MENRIYYGEYSLAYWIELILTQKITLPNYQRYFVWNESKLTALIKSLKDKRFVPPITLGFYKDEKDKVSHYIIDGQQRLTCILLAYLEIFPDKEKYRAHLLNLANGEDNIVDGEEKNEDENEIIEEEKKRYDNILEWTFNSLTEKGKTVNEIKANLGVNCYKPIKIDDLDNEKDFWETHFLGFSYIVPGSSDSIEQQRYYTKVFREINIQGEKLLPVESRRALYFLNNKLDKFFEPDFMSEYALAPPANVKQKMDFARYLCLLTAYIKHGSVNYVAYSYGYRMEEYIENYVYSVAADDKNQEYEKMFGRFEDIFADKDFTRYMEPLKNTLGLLGFKKDYPSTIDMDVYFFGLIYHVLFKQKEIDTLKKDDLKKELDQKIQEYKDNEKHRRSPARLTYMRKRLEESINLYSNYIK